MGHREGRDDRDERTEATERDDQAEQEEQVIDAVEDVEEALLDKEPRGLQPARIDVDDARIVVQRQRALRPAGGRNLQHGQHREAELPEVRVDRELRPVRLDRVLERPRRAGPACDIRRSRPGAEAR